MARLMRGKVPSFNNDYIELYVPKNIIERMDNEHTWVDDQGYWWGYGYMFATINTKTNESVVVVATKPLGQGYTLHKAISTTVDPGNIIEITGDEIMA